MSLMDLVDAVVVDRAMADFDENTLPPSHPWRAIEHVEAWMAWFERAYAKAYREANRAPVTATWVPCCAPRHFPDPHRGARAPMPEDEKAFELAKEAFASVLPQVFAAGRRRELDACVATVLAAEPCGPAPDYKCGPIANALLARR